MDINLTIRGMKKFRTYGSNIELDVLVDSDDWEVRQKVARQGYGLNKLINDEDYDVRDAALWTKREYKNKQYPYTRKIQNLRSMGYELNY